MPDAGSLAMQTRTVGASRPVMKPTYGTPASGGSRATQAERHFRTVREARRPVSASSASSTSRRNAVAEWAGRRGRRRRQNTPGAGRFARFRDCRWSTSYSSQT